MTGPPRDTQRALFYEAESAVHNLFAAPGPTVEIAGAQLTLPPEARFGSVESARRYVTQVLTRDSVRRRFPRATIDVEVRSRRGHRSAHYESPADPAAPPTIALPEMADGRWALRELVVFFGHFAAVYALPRQTLVQYRSRRESFPRWRTASALRLVAVQERGGHLPLIRRHGCAAAGLTDPTPRQRAASYPMLRVSGRQMLWQIGSGVKMLTYWRCRRMLGP